MKVVGLTFKMLLGLVLLFLLGQFTEAQRMNFGVVQGNRLLVVEIALLIAIFYVFYLQRTGADVRLLYAGAWLILAGTLGAFSWFVLPDQRLSRAIDRYYDLESDLESYKLHQKGGSYHWEKTPDGGGELAFRPPDSPEVEGRVSDWQRRELRARKLELEAAETRYRKGATRDSARETSEVVGAAGIIAFGLALVEFASYRRSKAKGVQAHNTVTAPDGWRRR